MVDIAEKYNITTKTISNIKKRFEEGGVKGLIHTRTSNVETIKVSTPEQAAIITDVVQHPDKTAKEIKDETSSKLVTIKANS
jgi:transposase